ncbi:hypothetical protein GCM10009601_33410 [Streptomyces thermospinosisporus]|uniref:LPXTG cell wall anchor domain-containing protein n=1 Tax=Streptomyces thermospinosisporus TaxID=161482 RepID=A0ABN1YZ61_9ACTN
MVTITVTETKTELPGGSGGKAGLDVPSTITAVAGLVTAGVGAASFLSGKKGNPRAADESGAR